MSFPTQPVFVASVKGWDAAALQHPMVRLLHAHSIAFDNKDRTQESKFYTTDFSFTSSAGETSTGPGGLEAMYAAYALFKKTFHEPAYANIVETEGGGYRLFGYARLYVNLVGKGVVERKVQDLQGRMWEFGLHGAFIIEAVRDEEGLEGLKIRSDQVFADPSPVMGEAIKRGLIPMDALTG